MKNNILTKTLVVALTVVTVLTSSITTTDVQAATPKAIKVQSFERTGANTAILKFKKPAKATKYQVRYSFYQDFRKGYTETSKSMKPGAKGKSKKYTTASKKYTTITTPKSGSTISIKIQDPRLKSIVYKYQESLGAPMTLDGYWFDGVDPRDVMYFSGNGNKIIGYYCGVQIRYYNKGWSAWSKVTRINNVPTKYRDNRKEKKVSVTAYGTCGAGYPAGSITPSGKVRNGCGYTACTETEAGIDNLNHHIDDCPYNIYKSYSNVNLAKYELSYNWVKK